MYDLNLIDFMSNLGNPKAYNKNAFAEDCGKIARRGIKKSSNILLTTFHAEGGRIWFR